MIKMKVIDYVTDLIRLPDDDLSLRTSKSKTLFYILSNARNFKVLEKIKTTELHRALLQRERRGSTAIGMGIALPHATILNLLDSRLLVGISRKGTDFESIDGNPTHLFFVLFVPENKMGLQLKLLAKIARVIKHDECRKRLMSAKHLEHVNKILIEFDNT